MVHHQLGKRLEGTLGDLLVALIVAEPGRDDRGCPLMRRVTAGFWRASGMTYLGSLERLYAPAMDAHVRRVWVELICSPDDDDGEGRAYSWRVARSSGLLLLHPESGRIDRGGPDTLDPDGFITASLAMREKLRRCGEPPERVQYDSADERTSKAPRRRPADPGHFSHSSPRRPGYQLAVPTTAGPQADHPCG